MPKAAQRASDHVIGLRCSRNNSPFSPDLPPMEKAETSRDLSETRVPAFTDRNRAAAPGASSPLRELQARKVGSRREALPILLLPFQSCVGYCS